MRESVIPRFKRRRVNSLNTSNNRLTRPPRAPKSASVGGVAQVVRAAES